MVDWRRAKATASARAGGNAEESMASGDGCVSITCGKSKRRWQAERAQIKKIQAMQCGTRKLVAWPTSLGDKEVWERSARATRKVLQAAIRRAHVEQKEWTKKQDRTQEKKQREKVKTSRRLHAAAR